MEKRLKVGGKRWSYTKISKKNQKDKCKEGRTMQTEQQRLGFKCGTVMPLRQIGLGPMHSDALKTDRTWAHARPNRNRTEYKRNFTFLNIVLFRLVLKVDKYFYQLTEYFLVF